MKRLKSFLYFLVLMILPLKGEAWVFIQLQNELLPYYNLSNVLLSASPGRSGSTLLSDLLDQYASHQYAILKTHRLPPKSDFKGKIIFIFSNPDQAAESALHRSLKEILFGFEHFFHVETADITWLRKIGNTQKQTLINNLLSYDALGIGDHLEEWLYLKTSTSSPEDAQILAIKYENLWEPETIQEIKNFLGIISFELPSKKIRGCKNDELDPREIIFREFYNFGTKEEPRYTAYNKARTIWEAAPPFQYLSIKLDSKDETKIYKLAE